MKRRDFLKSSLLLAGAVSTGSAPQALAQQCCTAAEGNAAKLPRRRYGNTDVELSIIGFGGIVVRNAEQDHANRVVAQAVERGCNYFDVAPSYGDAEVKLGPALEPYREDCFLACKTQRRDRAGAEQEFRQSLERLRTDRFDLYQLHAIRDVKEDVDAAFASDGVMPFLIEQKKQGRIRFLGFSAHSEEAALAAMDRYDFDSILFPINFACWYEGSFGPRVVETARKKGAARLALKAMAKQRWPQGAPLRQKYSKCWYQPLIEREQARLGLYWTLSQPVTAAIPPGEEECFQTAMDLAMNYKPLAAEDVDRLQQMALTLEPVFRANA